MQDFIDSGGYYFWDPLAAPVAVDGSLATCHPETSKVIEERGVESGRTLAAPDGGTVGVCTECHGATFKEEFLNTLNGQVP